VVTNVGRHTTDIEQRVTGFLLPTNVTPKKYNRTGQNTSISSNAERRHSSTAKKRNKKAVSIRDKREQSLLSSRQSTSDSPWR